MRCEEYSLQELGRTVVDHTDDIGLHLVVRDQNQIPRHKPLVPVPLGGAELHQYRVRIRWTLVLSLVLLPPNCHSVAGISVEEGRLQSDLVNLFVEGPDEILRQKSNVGFEQLLIAAVRPLPLQAPQIGDLPARTEIIRGGEQRTVICK